MGYDYHIGVDYHKAYSHIVVQDTGGKTLRSGRVRNDSLAVASFLSPYSGNAHAVMEATRNRTVMFDWLDEICDEVKLAHPLKVRRSRKPRSRPTRSTRRCLRICCGRTWCRRRTRRASGRARCA